MLYIADLFEETVLEYDPQRIYTDVFYFDGVSDVQKADDVLMGSFLWSFCFHGGGHVVLLFFSSIAKMEPVKVSHSFALFYNFAINGLTLILYYSL